MSKFIEIVQGVSVNKDEIVAVIVKDDGKLLIQTESRDFEIVADYALFMQALEIDEERKENVSRLTTQYFGG